MPPLDEALEQAVAAVWRIPAPGPDNLLAAPAFVALGKVCQAIYGAGTATFALHTALRSLGMPCGLPAGHSQLAVGVRQAAEALDAAFSRRTTTRRHLCPLDLADDIPVIAFGGARIGTFSAVELEILFDASRLRRLYPTQPLEAQRLAQFHWLVVEEEIELDPRAEARAVPVLFTNMGRDFGEIEPHLGRFPPVVEQALFFLLLAEWEEWSTLPEMDWRGFRIPWIYTLDDDPFVRPPRPPDPASLTLEPYIYQDEYGDDVEIERPSRLLLDDKSQAELALYTDTAWQALVAARATPLFATPVGHFIVRAFLGDGIDEIMAHMTAIEAAMGLESDHKRGLRLQPDPHPNISSTRRVAARIAALLNDRQAAQDFTDLFDIRSAFVHGRAGLQNISTPKRVLARSLARRISAALVGAASRPHGSREDVLADLLNRGLAIV